VTPPGRALLGDLRQFFALLDELGKTAPGRAETREHDVGLAPWVRPAGGARCG
jgi:hypothetical protein